MNEMTSAERIAAALENRPVDHVPFCPFLAYVWEHFPKAIQDMGQLEFHRRTGADPMWRGAPCPVKVIQPPLETRTFRDGNRDITELVTPVGSIRYGRARSEVGNTLFLVEHPLKTEADFKVQMWIEEHTRHEADFEPVRRHLYEGWGREGFSLGMLIPRMKSAFQFMVETLVGTEELCYALADFPDTVETLWRTMMKNDLDAVRIAAESPYEYFITWEDSGTQNYSPSLYDRYIGEEIGQWCGTLCGGGKKYVQHACGHVKELVTRMKAHGVHSVESLSAPPTGNITLAEARRKIGSEMGIIGGIEPTAFLNLPVDRLGAHVEQMIADGRGGPFVLANSDSCPPGVTMEKFKLVADVAKSAR